MPTSVKDRRKEHRFLVTSSKVPIRNRKSLPWILMEGLSKHFRERESLELLDSRGMCAFATKYRHFSGIFIFLDTNGQYIVKNHE